LIVLGPYASASTISEISSLTLNSKAAPPLARTLLTRRYRSFEVDPLLNYEEPLGGPNRLDSVTNHVESGTQLVDLASSTGSPRVPSNARTDSRISSLHVVVRPVSRPIEMAGS
jgi:hypothetical protein